MPVARYYKTLFLPPLEGQYLVWKNEFSQFANKVDEIIQLGNLIGCYDKVKDHDRRGANLATLNYIALWRSTFSNWTQIIGPNEIIALNFPNEWTNSDSNRILRKRWLNIEEIEKDNAFKVASVNKNRLVTHGGLTYGEWLEIGRPESPQKAADALNDKYAMTLYQGDCYRITGRPSFYANPIFADPLREVYPSWITAPESSPFGQVHSSGGLNTIDGRESLNSPFSMMEFINDVRYTKFGSIVTINDSYFYSVSPDMPKDRILKRLVEPWQVYIEKVPVVDMRDEIFDDEE